ncbi:hypothetical protein D3C81_1155590 [compost metagenome]
MLIQPVRIFKHQLLEQSAVVHLASAEGQALAVTKARQAMSAPVCVLFFELDQPGNLPGDTQVAGQRVLRVQINSDGTPARAPKGFCEAGGDGAFTHSTIRRNDSNDLRLGPLASYFW